MPTTSFESSIPSSTRNLRVRNSNSTPRMRLRAIVTILAAVAAASMLPGAATSLAAQQPIAPVTDTVLRLSLSAGRSLPLTTADPITRVAVANPEIADVVVVSERDLVINGKTNGETDIVLWSGTRPRVHYRVTVRAPSDRRMVMLAVRLAEVRRDVLRQIGVSGLHTSKDGSTRAGTGLFRSDNAIAQDGKITLPGEGKFLSILSDFGTKQFLAFLETEEQSGNARLLAEPNLLAADRDSASFLAGGELPIPVVQGGVAGGGQAPVTIQYREFGIRLRFSPDIVSDSIIKLFVRPEVSSLDYGNAILLNGFRIPALRTRRVESTVDIRRDQSIIISGLFNEERERVRTGVPLLMDVPILGALFSSSRWQNSETELLVIVTPTIIDPSAPGGELILPIRPDSRTPALDALRKRLPADTVKQR
jgi:Flp pilus assembly secretin CpaC